MTIETFGARLRNCVNDPMRLDIFRTRLHAARNLLAPEMIADRAAGGFLRVWFRVRDGGEASGNRAPMVKDSRNMPDLRRFQIFHAAQGKIVILRALEPFAEAADRAQKCGPVNPEMIDEVLPEKEFRVPIRFEEWIRPNATLINLVFVRIDQAGLRIAVDLERGKRQRTFGESIVLIEKRAPLSGGEGDRGVRTRGNVTVLLTKRHFDAGIATFFLLKEWPHAWIRRSIIGNTKFPALVELPLDGFNRGRENFQLRIVDGKNDGNERLPSDRTDAAAQGHPVARGRGVKLRDPILIAN